MKSSSKLMLLAFFINVPSLLGQTLSPEISELRKEVVRIDTTAWSQSLKANPELCRQLKSYSIIGVGEQTHGTHEFYRNKEHLIRFLVTEHGFGSIGLEAPMAEVALLNVYVQTGEGDLKDILKNFRQFTFETQEFVSLVEWVKSYNDTHQNKVELFGFDCQSPFALLNKFKEYAKGNNPEVAALADSLTEGFLQVSNELYTHQFDPESFRELSGLSDRLFSLLESNGKAAGKQKIHLNKYVENYRQFLLLNNPVHGYNMAKLSQIRDSSMAANVLSHWQSNPGRKVILWAHNAHVQKTPNAFSASMGGYLRQALKARYGAIGQTTSRGYYTAFNPEKGKVIDRNPIHPPHF